MALRQRLAVVLRAIADGLDDEPRMVVVNNITAAPADLSAWSRRIEFDLKARTGQAVQ